MCLEFDKIIADQSIPAANRRAFLQAIGAVATATVATASLVPTATAAPFGSSGGKRARTRVVLLGTAGGPALLGGARFGVSTAVVYEDRVYVFDLGLGAVQRLRNSSAVSKDTAPSFLRNVRGIFFTHMHSDHLADWPALYAIGPSNSLGDTRRSPIVVRGPGSRGTLPRVFPLNRPAPAVVNPEHPTPGVDEMANYLDQVWAADLNDRVRDNNAVLPSDLFDVGNIDLSGVWDVSPSGIPPRLTRPIAVHKDGEVTVTATLVDHRPTAPAFAYRIDTPDGSVVISGDTTVSANLIDLAQGADYLVHEVIDPAYIRQVTSSLPNDIAGPIRQHLLEAHTTIEQVGRDVAQPANVKNLVLTHLVPAAAPASTFQAAKRGFSGNLIVGEDLMDLPVW